MWTVVCVATVGGNGCVACSSFLVFMSVFMGVCLCACLFDISYKVDLRDGSA